ncbi:MAG: P-II family nitrogen regulator [Planctomycetota bacterium]|jgi:nitrogen regulatory protein PII
MRKIIVVVKPFKVDAVARALTAAGALALTLTEARGYGRQKGHLDLYRGDSGPATFLPKVRLECLVENEGLDRAVEAAVQAARTGRIGDGKLFVEMEDAG